MLANFPRPVLADNPSRWVVIIDQAYAAEWPVLSLVAARVSHGTQHQTLSFLHPTIIRELPIQRQERERERERRRVVDWRAQRVPTRI